MVQVLKDEVKQAIADAALEVFSTQGYARATMADIAAKAGVSTGNLYRYYANKDALLAAVLPAEVPRRFTRLLRERMQSFRESDAKRARPRSAHALASEELLAFTIAHRKQVVFLLLRAAGSPYQSFAERTVDALVELADAQFRALRPGHAPSKARGLVLRQIYQNLVHSTAYILEHGIDAAQITEAVGDYGRFHLAGLVALLDA